MASECDKYTSRVLLKMMMMDERNKICFDCNTEKSNFVTLPLAVFICNECAHTLGGFRSEPNLVVAPFSVCLVPAALALIMLGGNSRALTFLKEHGWIEDEKLNIHAKHTSKLAKLYGDILYRELKTVENIRNIEDHNFDAFFENFLKEEIVLARKKFPHATSISSAQFLEEPLIMNDTEAKFSLAKLSGSSAISSNDLFASGANYSATNSVSGFLKAAVWQIFESVG